jgi:hypothetical protein
MTTYTPTAPPARAEGRPANVTRRAGEWAGAALLVAVPTLFTAAYAALAVRFDYPDILRQPAGEVLTRFHGREAELLPLWWGMFASALLFLPASALGAKALGLRGAARSALTLTGTLAGLVQAVGLARWIFLVPLLAARYAAPDATDAARDAAQLLFSAFHQFLGAGVGEWLGYLFTGVWTLVLSAALWRTNRRGWAVAGFVSGVGVLVGTLEVFGVGAAGAMNALAYVAWSLWLIALGVAATVRLAKTRRAA